jgi:hypothetical protein
MPAGSVLSAIVAVSADKGQIAARHQAFCHHLLIEVLTDLRRCANQFCSIREALREKQRNDFLAWYGCVHHHFSWDKLLIATAIRAPGLRSSHAASSIDLVAPAGN